MFGIVAHASALPRSFEPLSFSAPKILSAIAIVRPLCPCARNDRRKWGNAACIFKTPQVKSANRLLAPRQGPSLVAIEAQQFSGENADRVRCLTRLILLTQDCRTRRFDPS